MSFFVLIRGGGDIASGVALRLYRAGIKVLISELAQPLAVRRLVSFAEAVYNGETQVEGITARRITDPSDTLKILRVFSQGQLPVLIDPEATCVASLHPAVVVDGRMSKRPSDTNRYAVSLVIGLGPGFVAGENCHVVVETNRGIAMGRVIWQGAPEADTGIPEAVQERREERVLRAPQDGLLETHVEIGDRLLKDQLIARVGGQEVLAPFQGILRGLLHPGMQVSKGLKIGDIDPRLEPRLCCLASDKSLAVGGGVLEAILSRPNFRSILWT